MECKQIEVYCYYKQQCPDMVLFFRVGKNYEAYQMDAQRIYSVLGLEIDSNESLKTVRFPVDRYFDYASKLGALNITAKTISCRNNDGEFDLPDLKTIKNEKEMDY